MTNRTIKFRAWDEGWKEMIHPYVIQYDINSGITVQKGLKSSTNELYYPLEENLTLMQFTGLYDCEGKEVWEGDVLEYKTYYVNIKWWSTVEEIPLIAERIERQRQDYRIEKNVVRFDDGSFCLGYIPLNNFCRNNTLDEKLETGKQVNGDYETKQWDFKVIGNIYEYSQLLKDES